MTFPIELTSPAQTIREIIPLLATPLRNQQKELVSAAAEILLSFAAAFDHIPQQRRLRLFTLLATSLGTEESLFAIIATLSDRFPGNAEVERFATHLLRQFTSVEALTVRAQRVPGCKPLLIYYRRFRNTLI